MVLVEFRNCDDFIDDRKSRNSEFISKVSILKDASVTSFYIFQKKKCFQSTNSF
mgnify:CR=1 FL=1